MIEPLHVLITVKLSDAMLERLENVSPQLRLHVHPAKLGSEVPSKLWKDVDILYTSGALPTPKTETRLKWIQSHSAGVDNLLPQPFFEANPHIALTTTSGIHATQMGEYVLGMILALGHRIPLMLKYQLKAEWSEKRYSLFLPQELRNSTVGILGYGSLGREVARLCKTFGAEVLATKFNVRETADDGYTLEGTGDPDGELFDRLYPPQATAFMVKDCDFVVITLPLTESTRNSVDENVINAMKPTAYLINVGRGGIVDEAALLLALQEGRIAGGAFDVFAEEPLPAESPLWKAPNFIISPHISGNTVTYDERAVRVFEENLRRYVEKRPLLNVVDRAKGY
ncbi:MAG: D-2-hydroxyacid dehydrogenase [Chloroflexi bacterium]|nr:D-2-hydroxyacid dehydrogenase [Chloroflexota bacterium]